MNAMNRSGESGNVLFYIFIAIVLFGGLSFAVSQSGRGSLESLTSEKNRLAATEIVDYSDAVAKAVGMMRLRGVTLADLRFSHPDLAAGDYDAPGTKPPEAEVFNTEGGGIVYRRAPAEALITAAEDYAFLSGIAIQDIGTTCAAATCADLVMAVRNLNVTVCEVIDRMGTAIAKGDPAPSAASFNFAGRFKGAMAAPAIIGNAAASAPLAGKPYGCLKNDADGLYYFYRVLWSQ